MRGEHGGGGLQSATLRVCGRLKSATTGCQLYCGQARINDATGGVRLTARFPMALFPASSGRFRRRWLFSGMVALAALLPVPVSAHGGGGGSILQFNPLVWLALILFGAAYFYATGLLEQR